MLKAFSSYRARFGFLRDTASVKVPLVSKIFTTRSIVYMNCAFEQLFGNEVVVGRKKLPLLRVRIHILQIAVLGQVSYAVGSIIHYQHEKRLAISENMTFTVVDCVCISLAITDLEKNSIGEVRDPALDPFYVPFTSDL